MPKLTLVLLAELPRQAVGVVEADLDAGAPDAPLPQRTLSVGAAEGEAQVAHAAVLGGTGAQRGGVARGRPRKLWVFWHFRRAISISLDLNFDKTGNIKIWVFFSIVERGHAAVHAEEFSSSNQQQVQLDINK